MRLLAASAAYLRMLGYIVYSKRLRHHNAILVIHRYVVAGVSWECGRVDVAYLHGRRQGGVWHKQHRLSQGGPVLIPHVPRCDLPARLTGLTARFARLGLIHREGPPLNFLALECGHRRSGGGAIGHLDKAKAFGAAGLAVHNDPDLVYGAIRLEELAEVMIRRTEGKIADKDIHTGILW